jgi:hypothetical protein
MFHTCHRSCYCYNEDTMKSLVCYIPIICVLQLINIWWVRRIIIRNNVFLVSLFFVLIYFQGWKIGGCFWYCTTSNCHFHKKTSNTLKVLQAVPFNVIIDLCIAFQIQREVVHEISQSSQTFNSSLVQSKKILNCFQTRFVRTTHSL